MPTLRPVGLDAQALQSITVDFDAPSDEVVVFRCHSDAELAEILKEPSQYYLEYHPQRASLPKELFVLGQNHLLANLALTCATTYQLRVAQMICRLIDRKQPLPLDCWHAIEIALHEALANAVIHGNLEVSSKFHDLDGMQDFYALIATRLADPRLNQRRIYIYCEWNPNEVVITVTDEGNGYDFTINPMRPTTEPPHTPHGLGRFLIESNTSRIQQRDGGRTLEMAFLLK